MSESRNAANLPWTASLTAIKNQDSAAVLSLDRSAKSTHFAHALCPQQGTPRWGQNAVIGFMLFFLALVWKRAARSMSESPVFATSELLHAFVVELPDNSTQNKPTKTSLLKLACGK
jgi:hypothetical protein